MDINTKESRETRGQQNFGFNKNQTDREEKRIRREHVGHRGNSGNFAKAIFAMLDEDHE